MVPFFSIFNNPNNLMNDDINAEYRTDRLMQHLGVSALFLGVCLPNPSTTTLACPITH